LFSIATNLAKNHFRSRHDASEPGEVQGGAQPAASTTQETELLSREAGGLVEGIVRRLPFKQRLAFTQRKIHGLDYGAIGKNLGCSAESARAHVFQALRKIRQGLDGYGILPGEPAR
jgi:DNA-directed RNA polymerase specialized sigma24 family protein